MTTDTPTPPVLPKPLLDLIGEYGYARTAGLSEFERLALWDRLIVAIKEYAAQHAANTERDLTECRAALRELVAVEDLQERIETLDWATYEGFAAACAEHRQRKPLAWSAARAILQSTGEGEGK